MDARMRATAEQQPHIFVQLLIQQFLLFLNYCSRSLVIVKETLELFDALSLTYVTSQHIAQLPEVRQFLSANEQALGTHITSVDGRATPSKMKVKIVPALTNFSASFSGASSAPPILLQNMAFLTDASHPHLHTVFYQILSRLIFKGSSTELFPAFIAPFTSQLLQLASISDLSSLPPAVIDQIRLFLHKLIGIVSAINNSSVYNTFHKWSTHTHRYPQPTNPAATLGQTQKDRPRLQFFLHCSFAGSPFFSAALAPSRLYEENSFSSLILRIVETFCQFTLRRKRQKRKHTCMLRPSRGLCESERTPLVFSFFSCVFLLLRLSVSLSPRSCLQGTFPPFFTRV